MKKSMPLETFKTIVNRQAEIRGLTQVDLAKRCGVTRQALWNFFAGKSRSVHLALKIASAVGLQNIEAYLALGLPIPRERERR